MPMPAVDQDDLNEKLAKARTIIEMCWPYMAPLAMRLSVRWTDHKALTTMAVDAKWRLYLDRKYATTLTVGALAYRIVSHELQHALGYHCDRLTEFRGVRLVLNGHPHDFANICHDLAIESNSLQFKEAAEAYRTALGKGCPDLTAPDDGLHPKYFMTVRGVPFPVGEVSERYAELFEAFPQSVDGMDKDGSAAGGGKKTDKGQCGSGGGQEQGEWEDGSLVDPNNPESGTSTQEQEVLRQQVAQEVTSHADRHPGTVPAGMRLWAKIKLEPPKIDWRRRLAAEIRSGINHAAGMTDYTYSRPNRRGVASGSLVLLPGFFQPQPNVLAILDTSGSMGSADYQLAFNELRGVMAACGFPKIPTITCDAADSPVQYINRIEDLKLIGGGGTDMNPAVRTAIKLKHRFLICLSDGYMPNIERHHGIRILAVLTTKDAADQPEWITTIRVNA